MGFSITGFVLEAPRVSQSNSLFTQTPDDYISDQAAYNAAYPSSETNPRTEYLIFVFDEGAGTLSEVAGLLANANFAWVKNEGTTNIGPTFNRFDYNSRQGCFKPLPGSAITVAGTLGSDSNTTRLKVKPPVQAAPWADAPYRLSVGLTGGTDTYGTFTVAIVPTSASFTSPPSLTVQLALDSGELNWNTTDLVTYNGQFVRFQQQQFFGFDESTGNIGFAPIALTDPLVFLNPKPGTGQHPLLRFGYGFYLQTVEVPNEASFTTPSVGTVQWSLATGRLKFNSTDATNYAGIPVYYDGVVFARDLVLPRQVLGNIASPSAISGLPPAGGDLIFALPGAPTYHQFPKFSYVTALTPPGETGVVQVKQSDGTIQFSAADQATYSGQSVTVIFGDLPIERGISLRLFRTPVNLDASRTQIVTTVPPSTWADPKDVSLIYQTIGSTWADPIIESPQVFLPAIPIDNSKYPFTVKVIQGQGSYTSDNFPRLDVTSPPTSLGYFINFDTQTFYFAQRKTVTVPIVQPTIAVPLPDPLLLSSNVSVSLDTVPLVLGEDYLLDSLSGIVSFITNHGTILAEGTNASFSGTIFTDSTADFVIAGVLPGHLLEVSSTTAKGVYTITVVTQHVLTTDVIAQTPSLSGPPVPVTVTGAAYSVKEEREVLADRFFNEVVLLDPSTSVERIRFLGTASNSPRLNIPVAYVGVSRFRFGPASSGQFSSVVLVATDGDFTTPSTGTVQISQATGNLNFATADLGKTVYWVRALTPKTDYQLSAGLGLIQFTDRMLALEEVLVTYTTAPPSTTPPTLPGPPVQEYATFLIRKEVTQDHPSPTSTLSFNTAGLPVASNPPPAVFRGGRPQQLGVQCVVDTSSSTITFLSDSQITDALPHGAVIGPSERVYIDYYVTQAVGGEKTITILNPPLLTAEVDIYETDPDTGLPSNSFVVHGDQTLVFPAGYLLRIEQQEVYLLGGSTYDSGTNETTVTLYDTGTDKRQVFQNSYTDPKVYVSSGPTPITSAPLIPAYFTPELQTYEVVARGMNRFLVPEDRTPFYKVGTVVLFTDGSSSFTDFFEVSGSKFDATTNRTEVTLTTNVIRQYNPGSQILLYSVRPVFEPPALEVQTSGVPILTQTYTVYRRVSGQAGIILSSPLDYTLDASGRLVLATELRLAEEFAIFYTGSRVIQAGSSLQASYTCQIAPNSTNGLKGQILKADYFLLALDTFFYRVETMTNFRGEYAAEIASKASSGSSGPQTSNSSQPNLFEQGRTSLYFDEKHLANQDIVARSSLLFYNDAVNYLEDLLQYLDGRVVGNNDGRFLFDGTTGIVNPSGSATFSDTVTLNDASASFTSVLIGRTVEILSGDNKALKRQIIAVPLATRLTLNTALPTTDAGKYRVLALNQIDDLIQVSPAPYTITFPPFAVTSIGTYKKYYMTGPLSRFYPTVKNFFGVSAVTDESETGDEVLDTKATNITLVSNLHTRLAWGVLTESTATSGATKLKIDDADGSDVYARPPFKNGMKCVVQRRDGTFINNVSSPITISSISGNTLTVSGLAGVSDIGTTVYRSPIDDSSQTGADVLNYYLLSRDYSFNGETGQVTYISAPSDPTLNIPLVEAQALSGKINLNNTLTAPLKFPALYGGIEDDDGEMGFPIQSPNPVSEDVSLAIEDSIIHNSSGTIRPPFTTDPFIGTGSLDLARTTITNSTPFGAPLPQVHDLVRILTGLNASSSFVRITSVGADTVTVDTPFNSVDSGFTYEIALSSLAVTGTATFPNTTTLVDLSALFLVLAKVGYTVVCTSSTNNGERRQISAINSNVSLTLTPALPSMTGCTYRIDNSLATYGGTSGDWLTTLETALAEELVVYTGEQAAILNFFNQVFTDIFVSSTGIATSNRLDDPNGTFITSEINSTHYVFIESGSDAGIYQVQSVFSETRLFVDPSFPIISGVAYRIVSVFGVSKESLVDLFTIYSGLTSLLVSATTFKALITTPVPVVRGGASDTTSFARATLVSDLNVRDTIVDARRTAFPTDVDTVVNILISTDTLYDKRWIWIDSRIDLESGLVVKQATAIANRIKAQADIYNQLVKLLAVEES